MLKESPGALCGKEGPGGHEPRRRTTWPEREASPQTPEHPCLGALVPLFLGWPLSPDPSVLPSGRCNPEMGHSRREEREGDGEVGGVGGVSQPRDFGLIVPILAIASCRWLLCLRLQSPDSDSVSPWESPSSGWTGEAGLPTSE